VLGISTSNRFYTNGPAYACGMCFRIKCLKDDWTNQNRAREAGLPSACVGSGEIVMQVTDSCPQCEANHWDIQALAYQKVRILLKPNQIHLGPV
jgi:Lytic transglycolase